MFVHIAHSQPFRCAKAFRWVYYQRRMTPSSERMSVKMVAVDAEWIRLHFILCDEMWTHFCENCCMQLSLWGMSYVCAQCTLYVLINPQKTLATHTYIELDMRMVNDKFASVPGARIYDPYLSPLCVDCVYSVPWFISSLHFGAHWIIRNIHCEIDIFVSFHIAQTRCIVLVDATCLDLRMYFVFVVRWFRDPLFPIFNWFNAISLFHSNAFTFAASMCRALIGD